MVTPEVATRLDPGERYRIWWFNRRRAVRTQVFENGENGRRYRKRSTTAYQPREEWIAVPVPDYGIICGLAPEARPDPSIEHQTSTTRAPTIPIAASP